MVRTKLIARKSYENLQSTRVACQQGLQEKRTIYLFKIKHTLPEQNTVNITKNRQIAKTINVREKCKYFNGKNRLIF